MEGGGEREKQPTGQEEKKTDVFCISWQGL
jgi:hypothetical protein